MRKRTLEFCGIRPSGRPRLASFACRRMRIGKTGSPELSNWDGGVSENGYFWGLIARPNNKPGPLSSRSTTVKKPRQVEAQLNRIPLDDWQKLFALIPQIEATNTFGELRGGDTLPDGSMTMHYWSPAALVSTFLRTANGLDILPVYEWGAWKPGNELLNTEGTDYNALDLLTLCKLLSLIVRADRFNDGYLVQTFENGKMLRILNAIKQNREQAISR